MTVATISAGVRSLTIDLVRELGQSPAGEAGADNIVCSGLGLWCALAVLLAGADGDAADELEALLRADREHVSEELGALDEKLAGLGAAKHALAMWTRTPTYRDYREALPTVTFANLNDPLDLDTWVREKTDGLIDRLPMEIGPSVLLAIVDAICLIAGWADPFEPGATKGARFTNRRGETFDVPTMYARRSAHDARLVGTTTTIDLVCNQDDPAISTQPAVLRLGLGAPDAPPAEVVADLFDTERRVVDADKVDLHLPSFRVRQRHDLIDTLRALGLSSCLTLVGPPPFPKLSPEPLAVDDVVQEALIDVDEYGVKAAAVTVVVMRTMGVRPAPTIIELRFDRPFAFALLDPGTNLPLFAGWVADPR